MMHMVGGLRWCRRWIREQDEGGRLGDLFGEGVVEHQGIVPSFVRWHIISPLRYFIRFAFSNPLNGF